MRLALDGPYNGHYIDASQAFAAGYALSAWPTGELVWVWK